MDNIILQSEEDPLGRMMLDYLYGAKKACVEVDSTTLEMATMCGEMMFRTPPQMDELELLAMDRCKGRVLDVGAGSGCHSLYLQETGKDVDSLDISPGCVEVMRRRKLKQVYHRDLFTHTQRKYDTILMLMNGLGIAGTVNGLGTLLNHLKTLLSEGGEIIADSTDLRPLIQDENQFDQFDGYFGETEFVMHYRGIESKPFPWLYVDFTTLREVADSHGFLCRQLLEMEDSRYLVRMYLPPMAKRP